MRHKLLPRRGEDWIVVLGVVNVYALGVGQGEADQGVDEGAGAVLAGVELEGVPAADVVCGRKQRAGGGVQRVLR